jgi:hypothetical protein
MRAVFELLLPAQANNRLRGSQVPFYLLILVAAVGTVRSLIHIFAPDGGAGSIAGMDLTVSGAEEVIFAFALWGSEQLILALLQWVVIFRYRSLVPAMWVFVLLEILGRMLVGRLKPVSFAHTPPGATGNYVLLVLSLLMLALSLWTGLRGSSRKPELSEKTPDSSDGVGQESDAMRR